MIVAQWGTPIDVWDYHPLPGSADPQYDKAYEGQWTLSSTPREPTAREAYVILSESVRKWQAEHPETEIKYLEISRSSTPVLRVQFVYRSQHSPSLALLLVAIAAAISFIATIAVPLLTIALVVIGVWAAYRVADYFIPKEAVYQCPIDGQKFSTYEALVAHYEAVHPGEKPPPKPPPTVWEYAKWAIVGIGVIAVAAISYKFIIGPALKKEEPALKRQAHKGYYG